MSIQPGNPAALNDLEMGPNEDKLDEDSILKNGTFLQRFLFEFKFANIRFQSYSVYGKLNWVKAFGHGGPLFCNGALDFSDSTMFLCLRFVVMCITLSIFVWSIGSSDDKFQWVTKITNWQTSIIAVYGLCSFLSAVIINTKYKEELTLPATESNARVVSMHMPWYVTIAWFCQSVALVFGLWVTIAFWILVNPLPEFNVVTHPSTIVDHFLNFFVVSIDFFCQRTPFPLMMFVWSILLSSIYVVFSVILYRADVHNDWDGGRYVYLGLSWAPQDVASTLTWILPTVLLINPLVACVVWYAHWFRASSRLEGDPYRVPWIDVNGSGGRRLSQIRAAQKALCCSACYLFHPTATSYIKRLSFTNVFPRGFAAPVLATYMGAAAGDRASSGGADESRQATSDVAARR